MKKLVYIVVILLFLAGAFLLGQKFSGNSVKITSSAKKPLYWVAPMNPNYRRDKPGKSPMGMDLVPVYAEADAKGTVKISPTVENNIGVRTAKATLKPINKTITAVGYVKADADKISNINSYSSGWVRDMQVQTEGYLVKKGQLLFKLYSPSIKNAMTEYLLSRQHGNNLLMQAGRKKLITLGVAAKELARLNSLKTAPDLIGVYAPQSGYISKLAIHNGQHVVPKQVLLTIANLSKVWVEAEVAENLIADLKLGQTVQVHFPALADKNFVGKISYIYPSFNTKTRSGKFRVVMDNPDLEFKPGMYVNLTVQSVTREPVISIPKGALIRLGTTNRVVLSLSGGKFRSVNVKVGRENANLVEIIRGLKVGDRVVTSAQFLLDSESNLKAGLDRLDAKPKTKPKAQHHMQHKPKPKMQHDMHQHHHMQH